MRISKSKFMAGVQCLKRLYLQVHEPKLATQPNSANEAIIEQGHAVGLLARELFPVASKLTVLTVWVRQSAVPKSWLRTRRFQRFSRVPLRIRA